MQKFVALLRGINVGGHKKVPMADLRKHFEKLGFKNVKTLLASGNVVFEGNSGKLNEIPGFLENEFGFEIPVIIIPFKAIESLVKSDPFKNIPVTPKTRLYVTFLNEKATSGMKIPYTSSDNSYQILKLTDEAIFSILDLDRTGTVDVMNILEKEFGKNITTRNYNTVLKIAKL